MADLKVAGINHMNKEIIPVFSGPSALCQKRSKLNHGFYIQNPIFKPFLSFWML